MKVLGKVLFDQRDTIPYYIGLEKLGIHTQGDTLEKRLFYVKRCCFFDDFEQV